MAHALRARLCNEAAEHALRYQADAGLKDSLCNEAAEHALRCHGAMGGGVQP